MKHLETSPLSRSRKSAVLTACCLLAAAALSADTIYLKDGTQILDCKVTSETDTRVTVRTPVGDMVVPRTAIYRIQRQKSPYDIYSERLDKLREGDVNGLFELAKWCRNTDGLRTESDELLARVIAVNENHAGARRLLGHVRVAREWVVPPPLSIRLKTGGAGPNSAGRDWGALDQQLNLFLKTRKDVRVASEADPEGRAETAAATGTETASETETETETETGAAADDGDPLGACTLDAGVVISRKNPPRFYGVTLGGPSYCASVTLRAQSEWIGRTPLKAAVDGQVPGAGGSVSLAIQNAIGSNSTSLHRFLDRVIELRAKRLEAELGKKKRRK